MSEPPPASSEPEASSAPRTANVTSYSLIGRVQLRDSAAWGTLWTVYGPYIQSRVRRLGVPESEVDDVAQDVFATVSDRIETFEPQYAVGSFRGWLGSVVRSRVADHFRRESNRAGTPLGADATAFFANVADRTVPPAEVTDDAAEAAAVRELYDRALEVARVDFAPQTVAMFLESVAHERPTAEIAAQFGVKPAAVRMAKARVLGRLRELLGEP